VNAGWFPDPSGQPGQRYFDGQRWTQHFVPTPPPSASPPPSVAVAVGTARANADDYGYSSCDDSSCTSTWNWYSPSDGGWDSSTTTCDSSGWDTY
jgi:Protein of unknown function (DUF2510)